MSVKILRIINRFNVGGISYNVAFLSKYLSPNFKTLIVGGKHNKSEKSSKYIYDKLGLKIHYINLMRRSINPIFDFFAILNYLFIHIKYKPDIVHSHASKAGFISRLPILFFKGKVKYVHTYHGNVFDGYFTGIKRNLILGIERILAQKTDLIIAISESQKNDLVNKYRISTNEKIRVINLGFDLSQFINVKKYVRGNIRKKYNVGDNEIVLITVGRLVPIKNQLLFLEIFKILKNNYLFNTKAFIVGDGEERTNLENYCIKNNLLFSRDDVEKSYDVMFTSWKENLPEFYALADFVLLTSINEGTPVSIIEAMAANKVVLSTNVGGVSDIIQEGSGFVCTPDPNDFVNKILLTLNNYEIYTSISDKARLSVKDKFHYLKLCENFESEYLNLLKV